jgi:arylsulfatase A-like enzyme
MKWDDAMLRAFQLCVIAAVAAGATEATARPNNIILFVPDGLRREIVTRETAPTFAAVRDEGVNFVNSHSLFPTLTMPNSSGLATGHYLGDTGVFANTLYAGFPIKSAKSSRLAFVENDEIIGDIDEHFGGNFIDEETILRAAHNAGMNTAAIGKIGPTLVFDHTARGGNESVIMDDATGKAAGIPLASWLADGLKAEGLPLEAPGRMTNSDHGDFKIPGTKDANVVQQGYFAAALSRVILPKFKADNKPFVIVFWSRDPDGTQHNQGDSFLRLEPGINGPTSLAAIRNADSNLAMIRHALDQLGLSETTNIVVSSDHGFSTISKQSQTSSAAKDSYADVPPALLPPGFVAIDIARSLNLPLFDPDRANARVEAGSHPENGNGYIGGNSDSPKIIVAANGGSDLIYLSGEDHSLAQKTIDALIDQDYVSGIFVDDDLGSFAGTLPLSAINLKGSSRLHRPSIVVNFKSFSTGCSHPDTCAVEVADTPLQQGQGMHGSFGRGDTANFTAATGPNFKRKFVNEAPVSNADIGKTIAAILGIAPHNSGNREGRVLTEAGPNGALPRWEEHAIYSDPAASGGRTIVNYQTVGDTRYFDAAGFEGRTVGLRNDGAVAKTN